MSSTDNLIKPKLSIILPCFNEEKSIGVCLDNIKETINKYTLNAEVIIVNNDSTDKSPEIVSSYMQNFPQLRLVEEIRRGYGSAYLKGFDEINGEYIFIADADNTYDFAEIPFFIEKINEGADLVVGNRFSGNMEKGAMPWTHQYIGNPILSFITRLFFRIKIKDIHCGARAIKKSAYNELKLQTIGMEFASEMIIKASKKNLKISEIPISYKKRIGDSKLNSFGDGWRHLRFILLYSPFVLFFLPGILMFLIGLISMLLLYFGKVQFLGVQLFSHPIFASALLIIVGYQSIFFAGFAKVYAMTHLGESNASLEKIFKYVSIEIAGITGIVLALIGIVIYLIIFIHWMKSGFSSLDQIKNSIVALTLTVIGIQTIFSAFMLSILSIKEK